MDDQNRPKMATSKTLVSAPDEKGFPVLIIDDNEGDSQLTEVCLGKAWPFERDLEIDYAADGFAALEKTRTTHYALIVLDWKMPGMGGSEVLNALRKDGVRSPVVVLSGLEREDIPNDLDALGAAFVNKNRMEPESLREAIAMSLNLLGYKQTFA